MLIRSSLELPGMRQSLQILLLLFFLLLFLLFLRLYRQEKAHMLKTEGRAWRMIWELSTARSGECGNSPGPHQKPSPGPGPH